MRTISHTERDGAKHGHQRVTLLLDMSSLDLFPSTLVVLARSLSGFFLSFFRITEKMHAATEVLPSVTLIRSFTLTG